MGLARLFSSPALSFFLLRGTDESNDEAMKLISPKPRSGSRGNQRQTTANIPTANAPQSPLSSSAAKPGQVAQLVEQRTENPRVGSSILPLAT